MIQRPQIKLLALGTCSPASLCLLAVHGQMQDANAAFVFQASPLAPQFSAVLAPSRFHPGERPSSQVGTSVRELNNVHASTAHDVSHGGDRLRRLKQLTNHVVADDWAAANQSISTPAPIRDAREAQTAWRCSEYSVGTAGHVSQCLCLQSGNAPIDLHFTPQSTPNSGRPHFAP